MVFVLIGIGLLAAAGLVFFFRRRSAAMQAASVTWPTVTGVVTDAKVQSMRDSNRRLTYMARVWYSYERDGVTHNSQRIAWGGSPTSTLSRDAEAIIDRYPVGSDVTVHYNPAKPSQAVLDPHSTGGLAIMTWLWIGFVVIGVMFIAIGLVAKP